MAKRNYPKNGYPSVTTVLGSVLRNPGLEQWFLSNTRQFCTDKSNKGKKIGGEIHDAIEQYINTGKASIDTEYQEEVQTALNSFILFRKENPEMKLTLSEIPLVNEKYCYNGTVDAPSPPILYDWKTSEAKLEDKPKIYPEHLAQCSAYVNSWNENNPNELIHTARIVAIAKDKIAYNIYEMDADEINECFNEVFLPCLKILNYQKRSK